MFWIPFYFQIAAPDQLAGAGGLVRQPQVGGAARITAPSPPAPSDRNTGPGSPAEPPDRLELSRRSFVTDAGGLYRRHAAGGAVAVLLLPPWQSPAVLPEPEPEPTPAPWSPEDEQDEWLVLHDFDFLRSELDPDEHAHLFS